MKFSTPKMEQLRLRLSLAGLPGAGKTYSALAIATHLVPGGKIGVIDTERGSASRYHRPRGPFEFVVLELDECKPQRYVEALHAAADARCDVVIVDSMSHAWDGLLDQIGSSGKQGWGKVRPIERDFWDTLLGYPGHLIATFRVKGAYGEIEDDKGRKKQGKVGMQAVQREGTEYEFDICLRLEEEGEICVVDKTRCSALTGKRFSRPGEQVVKLILPWLNAGVRQDAPAPAPAKAPTPKQEAPAEPAAAPAVDSDVSALAAAVTSLAEQLVAEKRSTVLALIGQAAALPASAALKALEGLRTRVTKTLALHAEAAAKAAAPEKTLDEQYPEDEPQAAADDGPPMAD